MKANNEVVRIDTSVYATSVSETERLYSVPLKLAAQDYNFKTDVSYAVTVEVRVNGVTYPLDASICGEGHRPDLSLDSYTVTCIVDDGAIISAVLGQDKKTLTFTSPEDGPLRDHFFDGAYSLSIPHEYEVNRIEIGDCYIQELI